MKGLLLLLFVVVVFGSIRLPIKVRKTNTLSNGFGKVPRIPLQGNLFYWGEYFTTIGLGTPPQYVELQVDTGSTDLIVYSSDCDGCNATESYNIGASSTVNEITCDTDEYLCDEDQCDNGAFNCYWSDSYGDGSTIEGILVTDVITIGSTTTEYPVSFGPIQSVDAPNGFEATGVDGIWGLAFEDLSGWGGSPAIELFISEYSLYDSFSLCLLQNNGVMEIGTNYSGDSRFLWTPITQEQWYSVELEDWYMGNTSLGLSWYDLNWYGVIVDSGTTLLIVDTQILNAIQTLLQKMCSQVNLVGVCKEPTGKSIFDGQCFLMTQDQVNDYPSLTLFLKNIPQGLTISPSDYLWQGTGTPDYYCLGIQAMDGLPVIIGDVFMQNFHTVFDRNAEQVGFGPISSCPQ